MKIDFSSKTVIVTGGTRGIGAAIVELFQQCNADVIATGTDTKEMDRINRDPSGGKLKYIHLDFKVSEIFLKLLCTIKKNVFFVGSSIIFKSAFFLTASLGIFSRSYDGKGL